MRTRQHRYPHLTFDALQSAGTFELEGFYPAGTARKNRRIACALLEDLMEARTTQSRAVYLSLSQACVMDELSPVISRRRYCTEEKITMKMNVTETVKQACGHWPRILPALGVKVVKNRHQSCPICGGDACSDRFRFDDRRGAARGTATGVVRVTDSGLSKRCSV